MNFWLNLKGCFSMTAKQEEQIRRMRQMGASYGKIAECLNLSCNTVKSFCQRRNLGGKTDKSANKQKDVILCAFCGKEVPQAEHRKLKKYCSDTCRMNWWKDHRHLIVRKSVTDFRCLYCGRVFMDYGSAKRKYCSHECYISYRFGGSDNEQRPVS